MFRRGDERIAASEPVRSRDLSDEEIVARGQAIYESRLKRRLEPEEAGKFIAVAVEDGDYEVADTSLEADQLLRKRHPDAVFYVNRIGYAYADMWVTPWTTPHAG